MSRIAILIESSQLKGHDDLPGARADVINFKKFLLSDFGGAWEEDEVKILNSPSKGKVEELLTYFHYKDYAFISFSGHGDHVRGKDIDETRVCLNDNEEMYVFQLIPKNPRCLVIIDSCRGITYTEKEEKTAALFEMRASVDYRRRINCRRIFDEAVSKAERGNIIMYSCDIGESADESNKGGYFSRALVDCSENWANGQWMSSRIYLTNNAFQCASENTTRRSPQQHPQFKPGRRMNHFPFAVSA